MMVGFAAKVHKEQKFEAFSVECLTFVGILKTKEV